VTEDRKPQNRCAIGSWPAGHDNACNDCDPCLFGCFPSEWCPTCGGDMWIGDRPCYNCDASGFRPLATPPSPSPDMDKDMIDG